MGLMGGKPKLPKPPLQPDEDTIKKAKNAQIQGMMARSGRDSTVLSDKLGG